MEFWRSSFCWYNWQNGLGAPFIKYLCINLGCDVNTYEDEGTNSYKKGGVCQEIYMIC